MPQPRIAALAILGLATVTAAGLALQQYRRAEALAAELGRREALINRTVQRAAQTAAAPSAPAEFDTASREGANLDEGDEDLTEVAPDSRRDRRGNRPDPGAIMEKLMQNPEFAEAMRTQQRSRLDDRYAELFAQLNLPPAQLLQLKDLLAEKQNVPRDVFSAARAEGLGRENRDEIRELINATQQEIDSEIRSTIGDQAFATLEYFEQTDTERRLVSSLADRLSYSATPLNAAQAEALVAILADSAAGSSDSGGRFAFGPGGNDRAATVTDESLARAAGVLAPDQVEALRQIQAEQQAAATVRDAMRNEFRNSNASRQSVPAQPLAPPTGG